MIQVLISLSESAYKEMCENGVERVDYDIRQIMRNGIPLPKGHGRLIDADALEFDTEYDGYCDGFTAYSSMAIGDAPTIIEADKEGADNE